MLKKVLSVILAGLLMNVFAGAAYACSQDEVQLRLIAKIRENVRKLGVGKEARVEVKVTDGRKLKGYIQETSEESFIVVEDRSGISTPVYYTQVSQLKGKNKLTAAKVGRSNARNVGVATGVVGILAILMYVLAPKT